MKEVYMSYKVTSNLDLIEQFLEKGYEIAIIDFDKEHYKDANTCAASFNVSARRFNKFNVRCVVRKDKLYMIRQGK